MRKVWEIVDKNSVAANRCGHARSPRWLPERRTWALASSSNKFVASGQAQLDWDNEWMVNEVMAWRLSFVMWEIWTCMRHVCKIITILGGHGRFRGACTTASGGEEYENPPMESSYAYVCLPIGLKHLFTHVVGMKNVWDMYEKRMRDVWETYEKIIRCSCWLDCHHWKAIRNMK